MLRCRRSQAASLTHSSALHGKSYPHRYVHFFKFDDYTTSKTAAAWKGVFYV